ncbi:protein adenylyltransferase SelO [Corynebacterium anserum]|uniref:Protein nucleotidyltransferase YdiU n=1 Tax=Corynebacterium anserum TaxID=2684406 RepID=A0A7G7YNX0_9CORY|nr:protein adenylyltransferase SelO family protein [Corynebacterium anserum]MBC2681788.1 hypothetical protein [Corynebacterium anserum]QNH96190.1 hypothetical protein GP473_05530 [Corynebacterium anserum]
MSTASAQTPPQLTSLFADALPDLAAPWSPVPFSNATLLILNENLARDLGFDPQWLRSDDGLRFLLGESTSGHSGSIWPHPVSQAYSGHQFGNFSPVLGDGRAVLLGEVTVEQSDGATVAVDIHLKGTGRTQFSRGASDGRACLGPMLREYLVSEAMHAMGIPTTRALAVILTGETVLRRRPEPGAVLVRVARSHLRIGSFQYARMLWDSKPQVLTDLLDFALSRHPLRFSSLSGCSPEYPHGQPSTRDEDRSLGMEGTALHLLDTVARAQAKLMAQWLCVGFVHGVMNTDNVTISGETIDYGPCAFLDAFDSSTCFSSIDAQGRYAFGRQPHVMLWNLQRFAEALLPLIGQQTGVTAAGAVDKANSILLRYPEYFSHAWQSGIGTALGLAPIPTNRSSDTTAPLSASQVSVIDEFIAQLENSHADLLHVLNALARSLLETGEKRKAHLSHTPLSTRWIERWISHNPDPELMLRTNPVYIPRNHLVEEALSAAESGEMEAFHKLLKAVTEPCETPGQIRSGVDKEKESKYRETAPKTDAPYITYCGT